MFIQREIESKLEEIAEHFPVVIVTGARQVGKTTLLMHFKEHRSDISYVTLDYPILRAAARKDPELFLQQYRAPLIIDEIQYAPELLPFIKIKCDNENRCGQYFLTGSQSFPMMKNVSESLAGRAGILNMHPLSRAELRGDVREPFRPVNAEYMHGTETSADIFQKIYRGGMPRLAADAALSPEDYFGAYMQTYIERDIRDMVRIKDETKFIRFVSCLAARLSQELNMSDICSDAGVDAKTADGWLSLLASSGLVYLLKPYSGNTLKRIVKRPKLYFMDTGLACYLSLWNNPKTLELSAMAGAFFEDYVVSEIIKSYANNGMDTRSRLCYYRDNNGKEIDLIILENGKAYPVEIKRSASPQKNMVKNFDVLKSLPVEAGQGALICLASETVWLDSLNKALPIGVL